MGAIRVPVGGKALQPTIGRVTFAVQVGIKPGIDKFGGPVRFNRALMPRGVVVTLPTIIITPLILQEMVAFTPLRMRPVEEQITPSPLTCKPSIGPRIGGDNWPWATIGLVLIM